MPRSRNDKAKNEKGRLSPEDAFGRVIRERRLQLGLTQADLEDPEGGGLERSHISRLEAGKSEVGLRGILHLAAKLQMSPEELIGEVVKKMASARTASGAS